jgi:hypothetical protein
MPSLESSSPVKQTPVEHTFIFLCGLHRSGRSVLHRILRAHPDISGFHNTGVPDDEGELLQNVFPKTHNFGGIGKFCFAPDAYLNETSRLVNDQNRVRLFAQWQPYWDVKKPFLMEKSGSNLVHTRFLQAMFPNSIFIFLVRHPIAVALATQKTSLPEMPGMVEHWSLAHKAMLDDRQRLKRHILVRYEDMITRPDNTLKTIYEFLKLPPQPVKENVMAGINREYFKLWEEYKLTRPRIYQDVMQFSEIPAQFRYVFDTPYVHPMAAESGTSES